ncbi:hypothetical protein J8281_18915, partial [Aquimarina sp. U1-2]|uniref:hypothetical protein n=1 Tax=Aquimarina sp. U1-2 TaxID=2823141 RepID=UPI001AEC9EA3
VTLEIAPNAVTTAEIADGTITSDDIAADAINAASINPDVAGAGLTQNASGALEVDVTGISGDGSITSPNGTVTLTGTPANSLFENVGFDVNVPALTGDGSITSTDLTVTGGANSTLNDVTLEIAPGAVGNTELATDAVTTDKILDGTITSDDIAADAINAASINPDVAGAGLTQNASGALEVDGTAITGDGNITSSDLTVG